jgi:hypothetical protein
VATSGFGFDGPVESVILAGVQERWTDERARVQLKTIADKYPTVTARWAGDLAQALDLLPEELYFLRCIDGSRTTDELLAKKNDPDVPQVSTLLFGLLACGVVEAADVKQSRRLPPPRPNLNPPSQPDDKLIPRFEQLSVITEYEDTPLPDKPPGDSAVTGKHPRVPILPTEDEEMFRGLDGDDSIVIDSRGLLRPGPAHHPPRPDAERPHDHAEPAALGAVDESHFGDLAQDDDETDFSGLASTSMPPKPCGPTPRASDSAGDSPAAQSRTDSSPAARRAGLGQVPGAIPKLDSGKSTPPSGPDSGKSSARPPGLTRTSPRSPSRRSAGRTPASPRLRSRPSPSDSLHAPTLASPRSPSRPLARPDSGKSAAPPADLRGAPGLRQVGHAGRHARARDRARAHPRPAR